MKVFRSNRTGRCAAALLALLLMQEAGAERRFTELGVGRGLDARIVTSLLVDRDGLLWVSSREGLYRYDGYEATAFLPDPGRPGSVSELDIRSMYEADDGTLWVATNTNGINRRDARTGEFVQFRHDPADPRSLSHASVFAVAQDAGGQVWAGTRRGLNRLEPDGRGFAHFLHEPGNDRSLVHDWVSSLHGGPSGQLSIGTLGGGISRWIGDKEDFEYFSLAGLSDGTCGFDDVFAFEFAALAGIVLLTLGLHLTRLRSLERRNAVLEQLQLQREQALEHATRSRREFEEASMGLRQLTRRLESVKEQERSRISRELHDEFGQTLTAAKLNLQMLRGATGDVAVARRLDDAVGMVDRMIRQSRDIARGLRPPLLDEAGLVAALEDHLKTLGKLSDVRIELDAAPGVANVSPALNTAVFRVIQEAVNNAMRHARARTIRVVLRNEPDAVSIVIQDDGVGFDPEAVGRRIRRGEHLGLLGMTERVRYVGGTIEFDSRPGAGSRIRVRVPFSKDASDPGAPLR